jgi:pimeloyl-ACP methyl ester carboxylesterase
MVVILGSSAASNGSCRAPVTSTTSIASWYLVAQADQAIPPDAERLFAKRMGTTVVEVDSNHLPMVSHPDEVVKLINAAVEKIERTGALTSISG